MIRRAARSVKKFYGLGRYDVLKKGRGVKSTRAAAKKHKEAKEPAGLSPLDSMRRKLRREERLSKSRVRTRKKAAQLSKAHRTRRKTTKRVTGLAAVGAGGATYLSRSKRKKKR